MCDFQLSRPSTEDSCIWYCFANSIYSGALEALSSENASNVLIDAALVEVGGEAYKDLINQTVTKVKSKLTDSSQTFITDEVDIHAFNNNDQHSAEETKQAYNEVLNLFQSQLKMTSEQISMSCGLEKIIYRGQVAWILKDEKVKQDFVNSVDQKLNKLNK